MNKISVLFFSLLIVLPANAMFAPDASMIQVHDMQMIQQQKFRMEEINDYKEVKEEKERFEKRITQPKPVVQKFEPKSSEFSNENGEIKIKYTD